MRFTDSIFWKFPEYDCHSLYLSTRTATDINFSNIFETARTIEPFQQRLYMLEKL